MSQQFSVPWRLGGDSCDGVSERDQEMPTVKLTRRTIGKLGASGKAVTYYDDSLRGFGLKVLPSGQRRWIVEYRPNGGGRSTAKRRLVLGPCASRPGEDGLTPEEARRKARGILVEVWDGGDPASERAKARQALTLDRLFAEFLKETAARRKSSTTRLYRSYWLRHAPIQKCWVTAARSIAMVALATSERRMSPLQMC